MKAWLTIALVALAYSEFEWPKYLSYKPPLEYKGSKGWKLSLRRSRKCFPLALDAWNIIFQFCKILLHLLFLSKSQDDLYGSKGIRLNFFISLLTIEWRGHLLLLEQSQNLIEFEWFLLKKDLSSFNITIDWSWYEWIVELNQWLE